MIIKEPIKTIAISFTEEETDTLLNCSDLLCSLINTMKNHECTEVENPYEDTIMTADEIEGVLNALDFLVNINEMY